MEKLQLSLTATVESAWLPPRCPSGRFLRQPSLTVVNPQNKRSSAPCGALLLLDTYCEFTWWSPSRDVRRQPHVDHEVEAAVDTVPLRAILAEIASSNIGRTYRMAECGRCQNVQPTPARLG
jgi:hypothetical protein